MSWDPHWEQIFRVHDWGRYPPEELIRFAGRNFFKVPARKDVKILEIGCGTGANIWFLAREGFDTYGIDGSATAIAKAKQRLQEENLKAHLQVGDIVGLDEFYADIHFDAVVDVACLQHNKIQAIRTVLDQVLILLKPQGKIFSMMIAAGSYGDSLGQEIEPGTFADILEGPLHNRGLVHFFEEQEVQQLFKIFADIQLEYSTRSLNNRQHWYKHWVIEGANSL
jgi:SAM-dependent methyltransferase